MAEAVEGVGGVFAAGVGDDGVVEGLVIFVGFVVEVGDGVAGLHDAGAEKVVVAAVVGCEVPANGASACGLTPAVRKCVSA